MDSRRWFSCSLLALTPLRHPIRGAGSTEPGRLALIWLKSEEQSSTRLGGIWTQDLGDKRHAHQIGKARGLHLGHQIGPVDFDRARTDTQVERNLLVGPPG